MYVHIHATLWEDDPAPEARVADSSGNIYVTWDRVTVSMTAEKARELVRVLIEVIPPPGAGLNDNQLQLVDHPEPF
jgi:hypothetical protein